MPTYEYVCTVCNLNFSEFFRSFTAAEPFIKADTCPNCGSIANRKMSAPLPPHLLGSPHGYAKPSPTKRHSHKVASEKDGNKYSNG